MSDRRLRASRGKRQRRRAKADRTLQVQVASPPVGGAFQPLAPDDLAAVIEHAFSILEGVGMADTPTLFAGHLVARGARHRADGRLCMPRSMVEAALTRAPAMVVVPGFTEDRGIDVGGTGVHIGSGGAAVQTLDAATGVYRESTISDLWKMMRVLNECSNIHSGYGRW